MRSEENIQTALGAILGGLVICAIVLGLLCIWATGVWGTESGLERPAGQIWARSYQETSLESILNRSMVKSKVNRPARTEWNIQQWDSKRLARIEVHEKLINDYSRQFDLDADLIKAVIYVESGGDPLAVSHQGAAGLMQLMPATAADLGVADRFDVATNIEAGTRYLRLLLNRFNAVELALWAYNAGPESVRRGSLPLETREYVPQVLRLQRHLKAREFNARIDN